MWLFLLESGAALALFLFILWWTLPKKEKDPVDDDATRAVGKEDDHEQR